MSVATAINALKDAGEPDIRGATLEFLIQLAEAAWRQYPGKSMTRARREYVKAELRDDPTWIILERIQPQALIGAVSWLLHQAHLRREEIAGRTANGGGLRCSGDQGRVAPAEEDMEAEQGRNPTNGDHGWYTRGSESAISGQTTRHPAPTAPPDRTVARVAATLRVLTRHCRLDTVLIDGVPIGDCTVGQVRDWAARRKRDMRDAGRDVRFALALVSNLPAAEVIRQWWRNGAEVDAMYDKAEAEYAA